MTSSQNKKNVETGQQGTNEPWKEPGPSRTDGGKVRRTSFSKKNKSGTQTNKRRTSHSSRLTTCSVFVLLAQSEIQAVVPMSVRTLGDAWRYGWTARAVCQFTEEEEYGKRSEHRNIACRTVYELDLKTLIWTRGDRYPREDLDSRLRCPSCGQRQVHVLWNVPNQPRRNAAAAND
jgi:hypothetical protein